MLNFHRESWNPVKKHSKALVFFAVSKQIPIVYSADHGRAETMRHNSCNADPSAPIFLANVHCLMGEVWCNFEQNQTKTIEVTERKPISHVCTISNNTSC